MTLQDRINKYRQKKQGHYRPGNTDFNYKEALGLAEYYRIEKIVKKEACVRTHDKNQC